MINFYQKYRPRNLSTIIGQSHVTKILLKASANDQLANAYIFQGSRGIGKTSISKILAKAYNCLDKKNGDVCNQCSACKLIDENKSQDVYELDAATNNGVDEIRKIIDTINYSPMNLKTKVYILDEAHMLSTGAWNALLKTLEDPPKHVAFIFATTEFHKIPLTVVSRCQSFNFKKLELQEIIDVLNNVVKNEELKIQSEAISKIAVLASGSARDSLSILQQLAYDKNNEITLDKINETFGLINLEIKLSFLDLINKKDYEGIVNLLNEVETKGINFALFIQDFFAILLDLYIFDRTRKENLLKVLDLNQVRKINYRGVNLSNLCEKINNLLATKTFHNNLKESLILLVFEYFDEYNNFRYDYLALQENISNQTRTNKVDKQQEIKPIVEIKKQEINQQIKQDLIQPIKSPNVELIKQVDQPIKQDFIQSEQQEQITKKTRASKTKKPSEPELIEQPIVENNTQELTEEFSTAEINAVDKFKAFSDEQIDEYLDAIVYCVFNDKSLMLKDGTERFNAMQKKFQQGNDKEMALYKNSDSYLTNAKPFAITNKAAILIKDDEQDAAIINAHDYDNNKVHTINYIFNREIYVFATTKEILGPKFKKVQQLKPTDKKDLDKINYYKNLYDSLDVKILKKIKKQKTQAENLKDLLLKKTK
ncbi:DNA polymerase III subunit gamma/tau [Mycoplasma sp. E35C]|uniref:DNA polymerase III subunit gamma/tau n=1 Tax=Mycoplasma sp. E35C TaxID=2801918 RepID=UPI001CA3F533|nr:DNA polymerase III subunit gamma/tau [Mycoplasma sp. E35C]QZX49031.1 DNA polymerase III subunit gamma/tau [Mycoplasma sp. E35C]